MLVLTRKPGEAILVDTDRYRFEVLGIDNGIATLELSVKDKPAFKRRLLKLRPEMRLTLPDAGEMVCCSVRNDRVRLGFQADRSVKIIREEVADQWVDSIDELPEWTRETEAECEGHISTRGDYMGASFYCDGSCQK